MPYKSFSIDGVGNIMIYKRRLNRSIRLTVEADGGIRVTIPNWVPYRAGLAFASARRGWIVQQTQRHAGAIRISEGQRIGKSHKVHFQKTLYAGETRTSVRAGIITISYGAQLSESSSTVQSAVRTACLRALKKEAIALLLPRLHQLAEYHQLSYKSGTIKQLKSRWGSCDQNKNIVLNLYLVQLPWHLIDYVILHELAHTQALHHGTAFWTKLEMLQPGARGLRKAMRAYRPSLIVSMS